MIRVAQYTTCHQPTVVACCAEMGLELISTPDATPASLAAHVYREILAFLAGNPTPERIAALGPTPEVRRRLQILLGRERADLLTVVEQPELAELIAIAHHAR